jgi:hypothetical protein
MKYGPLTHPVLSFPAKIPELGLLLLREGVPLKELIKFVDR